MKKIQLWRIFCTFNVKFYIINIKIHQVWCFAIEHLIKNSILIIKILILRHIPHIFEIFDSKYMFHIYCQKSPKLFRIGKDKNVNIYNITLTWNYSSWIFGNPRIIKSSLIWNYNCGFQTSKNNPWTTLIKTLCGS